MQYRINSPDGAVKKDGSPVKVLPEGTVLSNGYKVAWQSTDKRCIVYKAIKEEKFYLIKEVHASDREAVKALTNEHFVLEQFSHPGIQRCIERFRDNDWHYLVLEYIDGMSLDAAVSTGPPAFMVKRHLLDWADQLYDLFMYLRQEKNDGIYGDTLVKKVIRSPRNIIRDGEGKIYLVDVGVSCDIEKPQQDEMALLQPLAAPEFYEGRDTDERSDVFTLGAIFYYLLTGGKGRNSSTGKYLRLGDINRNVSPGLEAIIMKALQSNPDDRFHSVKAMRAAHMAIKNSESGRKSLEENGKRPFITKAMVPAACTALAAILVLIAIVTQRPKERPDHEKERISVAGMTSTKISALQGSTMPQFKLPIDPMLYPDGQQAPASPDLSSTPSTPAEPLSSTLSIASSPAQAPAIPALSPHPLSAPAFTEPAQYPTGEAQVTERKDKNPTVDPDIRTETGKKNPKTKEEMLALLLAVNKSALEPEKGTFISPENDYSISIPSGYYKIRDRGTKNNLFVNIDDILSESSLRMIQISATNITNIEASEAIARNKIDLISSGVTITDERFIPIRGSTSRTYKGYSFTYISRPPVQFHMEENEYIHQDIFFAHPNSQYGYRIKFCALKDGFSAFQGEFEDVLHSLHFTIARE